MAIKKGLGRGFESLIPTQLLDDSFDPTKAEDQKVSHLLEVNLKDLEADPDQPRRHFDEAALEELAASIKEHGVLQPLVVTRHGDTYSIVAGERRFRAAQLAGLTAVPVIVRSVSAQNRLELALIENLQRSDLNPLEVATGYLKLHQQFNMSYEQIGTRIGGKAVSTISNMLRLLQLPSKAKQALVEGRISEGHARQILALDNEVAQTELLHLIISRGWSVRQTEQYVSDFKKKHSPTSATKKATATETPETKALSVRLKTPVSIKPLAKGGQIVIRYQDESDLERLTDLLIK